MIPTPSMRGGRRRGTTRSVTIAMDVIAMLARMRYGYTAAEIAECVGVSKTTVGRVLAAMEAARLATRDHDNHGQRQRWTATVRSR